jgi:predicted nucleotidyltransferase
MKISDLNLSRQTEEQRMAQDNCIFLCRVGSTMYGTNTPESDDDMIGIFIEDINYIVGRKRVEQVEFLTNSTSSGKRNKAGDKDYKFYSLSKIFKILSCNNPNSLELLFAPTNCILCETDEWRKIKENKDLFLSLKSFHSFSGYAHSQGLRLEIKSGNNTGRKDLQDKYG